MGFRMKATVTTLHSTSLVSLPALVATWSGAAVHRRSTVDSLVRTGLDGILKQDVAQRPGPCAWLHTPAASSCSAESRSARRTLLPARSIIATSAISCGHFDLLVEHVTMLARQRGPGKGARRRALGTTYILGSNLETALWKDLRCDFLRQDAKSCASWPGP